MLRRWLLLLLHGTPNEDVLTDAVGPLFNTIGKDDILQEVAGTWVVGNKPLNSGQRSLLISEAKNFLSTTLWRVLQVDIKFKANRSMFERAQSTNDIVAGKLWLYTLDCIKTRLESLAAEHGTFNDDAHPKK